MIVRVIVRMPVATTTAYTLLATVNVAVRAG